jgi:chromosome segregation protein
MERDFESYNKSVKSIMQEAQRGSLRGVHGPVSRLIRTEDRYTIAMEIALGAAMQQIVVDSEAEGKAAITYLKRIGGGRATFLPLTTIQGKTLQESGLDHCRGFVGIASELTQCNEVYRPIVDHLLGRTVIVQDLDAAIFMANKYKNRFKIVTLDGQVMNPGGSMTGGSVNKEAGILSRANELEKLSAQEKDLQIRVQATEAELTEAKRAADQVEFQLTTAREQLRQAEDACLRLEGQEKQHEILLNAILDAAASAKREWETLAERRTADTQRCAENRGKIQVYTAQLEEIRQNLTVLEGTQSEAAQATAYITESMTALKTEEAALEAERHTAHSHIADMQDLSRSMEGDKEKKRALID